MPLAVSRGCRTWPCPAIRTPRPSPRRRRTRRVRVSSRASSDRGGSAEAAPIDAEGRTGGDAGRWHRCHSRRRRDGRRAIRRGAARRGARRGRRRPVRVLRDNIGRPSAEAAPSPEDPIPRCPPGLRLGFGQIATVCGVSARQLGTRIARQAGFTNDTAPDSRRLRTFHVTGFADDCARQFSGVVAMFGDAGMHEAVRYNGGTDDIAFSETDAAYEEIKGWYCGVPSGQPCGGRIDSLSRELVFLSVYSAFALENDVRKILAGVHLCRRGSCGAHGRGAEIVSRDITNAVGVSPSTAPPVIRFGLARRLAPDQHLDPGSGSAISTVPGGRQRPTGRRAAGSGERSVLRAGRFWSSMGPDRPCRPSSVFRRHETGLGAPRV